MTIDDLLCAFHADSKVQINIHTDEGTLVFIPNADYYQSFRHWTSMEKVGVLPVRSLNVEPENMDDQPIMLLVINENT